jgi:hypothetical protein
VRCNDRRSANAPADPFNCVSPPIKFLRLPLAREACGIDLARDLLLRTIPRIYASTVSRDVEMGNSKHNPVFRHSSLDRTTDASFRPWYTQLLRRLVRKKSQWLTSTLQLVAMRDKILHASVEQGNQTIHMCHGKPFSFCAARSVQEFSLSESR